MIVEESRIDFKLYKWVFPLDVARPSIAVVGPTQTFTSVPPVFETQARWVAQVFAGNSRLPPPDYREAYLQKKREMYIRNFRGKTRVCLACYICCSGAAIYCYVFFLEGGGDDLKLIESF